MSAEVFRRWPKDAFFCTPRQYDEKQSSDDSRASLILYDHTEHGMEMERKQRSRRLFELVVADASLPFRMWTAQIAHQPDGTHSIGYIQVVKRVRRQFSRKFLNVSHVQTYCSRIAGSAKDSSVKHRDRTPDHWTSRDRDQRANRAECWLLSNHSISISLKSCRTRMSESQPLLPSEPQSPPPAAGPSSPLPAPRSA